MDNVIYPEALPDREAGNRETVGKKWGEPLTINRESRFRG